MSSKETEFKEQTFYFVYRSHAYKNISLSLNIMYLFQKEMDDQNISKFVAVPTTKGSINKRVKK